MNFTKKVTLQIRSKPVLNFAVWTLFFYILMIGVFFYLVHSDLSTAPQFIYSEF